MRTGFSEEELEAEIAAALIADEPARDQWDAEMAADLAAARKSVVSARLFVATGGAAGSTAALRSRGKFSTHRHAAPHAPSSRDVSDPIAEEGLIGQPVDEELSAVRRAPHANPRASPSAPGTPVAPTGDEPTFAWTAARRELRDAREAREHANGRPAPHTPHEKPGREARAPRPVPAAVRRPAAGRGGSGGRGRAAARPESS